MKKPKLDKTIKMIGGACLFATCLPALSQSQSDCSALQSFQSPHPNFSITAAEFYDKRQTSPGRFGPSVELPPHCHVEGEIDRRTGADGKSYALRFAVNLPQNWNGGYLFQGGGGLNGSVREPMGMDVSGGNSALHRGFAVISTDSGHQGEGGFDASFMADQEAALNFLFLGNMRVTLATKPVVEHYYGKDIDNSYFVGCSTGGREGMIMAQRYPYLYDGIVSGAPAIRTGLSNLGLRWLNVQLNQAAPKGDDGLPLPGGTFNKEEQKLIVDGMLQACDSLDGAKDGLIFNTTACDFDPMDIACDGGSSKQCLAPEKAQALKKAVAGPVDSRGVQVYPKFLYDTGFDDSAGFMKGLLAGGATPPVGRSVAEMMSQDVDAEFIEVTAFDSAIGDSMSYHLSTFIAEGGKHIFYHGVSDPWFSAMDTVGYYQNMGKANSAQKPVEDYSRLFLAPGMGHCRGGEHTLDNFDMLSAIVDWVEKDQAPQQVVATGQSMPGVSRPLCPYPQHPHYTGSGDMDDAKNFECRK